MQIAIEGHEIPISAERHLDKESPEGAEFRRIEHRRGAFQRRLTLPQDIDHDGTEARRERGVLTIDVPRTVASEARKIAIQGE